MSGREVGGEARPDLAENEPQLPNRAGMLLAGMLRSSEGPWEIGGAEFHSFGNQLSGSGLKGGSFGEQLVLSSLTIGRRLELGILLQVVDLTVVEIDLLMKRSQEVLVVRHRLFHGELLGDKRLLEDSRERSETQDRDTIS
jgi:hypothetical protein